MTHTHPPLYAQHYQAELKRAVYAKLARARTKRVKPRHQLIQTEKLIDEAQRHAFVPFLTSALGADTWPQVSPLLGDDPGLREARLRWTADDWISAELVAVHFRSLALSIQRSRIEVPPARKRQFVEAGQVPTAAQLEAFDQLALAAYFDLFGIESTMYWLVYEHLGRATRDDGVVVLAIRAQAEPIAVEERDDGLIQISLSLSEANALVPDDLARRHFASLWHTVHAVEDLKALQEPAGAEEAVGQWRASETGHALVHAYQEALNSSSWQLHVQGRCPGVAEAISKLKLSPNSDSGNAIVHLMRILQAAITYMRLAGIGEEQPAHWTFVRLSARSRVDGDDRTPDVPLDVVPDSGFSVLSRCEIEVAPVVAYGRSIFDGLLEELSEPGSTSDAVDTRLRAVLERGQLPWRLDHSQQSNVDDCVGVLKALRESSKGFPATRLEHEELSILLQLGHALSNRKHEGHDIAFTIVAAGPQFLRGESRLVRRLQADEQKRLALMPTGTPIEETPVAERITAVVDELMGHYAFLQRADVALWFDITTHDLRPYGIVKLQPSLTPHEVFETRPRSELFRQATRQGMEVFILRSGRGCAVYHLGQEALRLGSDGWRPGRSMQKPNGAVARSELKDKLLAFVKDRIGAEEAHRFIEPCNRLARVVEHLADDSGYGALVVLCQDGMLDGKNYIGNQVPMFTFPQESELWRTLDEGSLLTAREEDLVDMMVQDGATVIGLPSGDIKCRTNIAANKVELAGDKFRVIGPLHPRECIDEKSMRPLIESSFGMRRRAAVMFSKAHANTCVIVVSSDGGYRVLRNGDDVQ